VTAAQSTAPEPPEGEDEGRDDEASRGRTRHSTPSQRRTSEPRRIHLPWWGLTLICAAVGFALAEWLGAVVAGALGFFAWKLR